MKALLVLIWMAVVVASALQAQEQPVSGTVTSSVSGQPLPIVKVRVKGTNQETTADAAGRYTLTVSSLSDTLVFSLIGYKAQEVAIDGRTEVDVQLEVLPVEIEAMVVTGYRVQDRRTVTASVSSVSSQEFADQPADNLSNALAGRLAGATVIQNAGTPGRESSIRIRAVGTLNNADPLYVIDGIVSDKFTFDGRTRRPRERRALYQQRRLTRADPDPVAAQRAATSGSHQLGPTLQQHPHHRRTLLRAGRAGLLHDA